MGESALAARPSLGGEGGRVFHAQREAGPVWAREAGAQPVEGGDAQRTLVGESARLPPRPDPLPDEAVPSAAEPDAAADAARRERVVAAYAAIEEGLRTLQREGEPVDPEGLRWLRARMQLVCSGGEGRGEDGARRGDV